MRQRSRFIIKPKSKKSRRRKTTKTKRDIKIPRPTTFQQAKALYNSPVYKAWRVSVFERDDHACQMCGQQGGSLEAHHIRPKRRFPKLTLEVNNGITLCFDCHRRIVTGKEEHFVFIFDRIVDLNLRGI
jgi:5-methylcytosine-specific restriction endonuclease McrA